MDGIFHGVTESDTNEWLSTHIGRADVAGSLNETMHTNHLALSWCVGWSIRASQVTLVVKNQAASTGDAKGYGFDSWFGKIPWRRAWQPTPVFLPGEVPSRLHSIRSQKVGHDWCDLSCTQDFRGEESFIIPWFAVVQSLGHVQLFATSWTAAHQASLSFTLSQFVQTHVFWVGVFKNGYLYLSSSRSRSYNSQRGRRGRDKAGVWD